MIIFVLFIKEIFCNFRKNLDTFKISNGLLFLSYLKITFYSNSMTIPKIISLVTYSNLIQNCIYTTAIHLRIQFVNKRHPSSIIVVAIVT